eukprot:327344-Amphidinium_carterae.1
MSKTICKSSTTKLSGHTEGGRGNNATLHGRPLVGEITSIASSTAACQQPEAQDREQRWQWQSSILHTS